MAKKHKSWQEKLEDSKDLPKVIECKDKGKYSPRWGMKAGDTLVIPAPKEVDDAMKKVGKGELITALEIRKILSKKHKTTSACPMTTGIFTWIAANAAEEQREQGKINITPYWRTLKVGGELNPKYPGGTEAQKKLLEKEGHKVIQKGKKYVVVDFEKCLVEPKI